MPTDRELLELAAKAAGYDIAWFPRWPGGGCYLKTVVPAPADPILSKELPWNPLTDDGDALRLAMALSLHIEWRFDGRVAVSPRDEVADIYCMESTREDRQAATRWAIVRAAAELAAHPKQHNDGGADE